MQPQIEMTLRGFIVGVILLGWSTGVLAAVPILDGDYAEFWTKHAIAVIRVKDVGGDAAGTRFSADVLGVAATDFVVPTTLSIDYRVKLMSAIEDEVKSGEILLVCVERTTKGWALPTAGLSFMSSGNAIVRIASMEDPRVAKVQQAVQKLRQKIRQGDARARSPVVGDDKVALTVTATPDGKDAVVEVRVMIADGQRIDLSYGGIPQLFGVYVLGPWGSSETNPPKINWMHQEVSQGTPVVITPDRPWTVRFRLSEFFNVNEISKGTVAKVQLNVKFFDIGSMKQPIDSGAVTFDIGSR